MLMRHLRDFLVFRKGVFILGVFILGVFILGVTQKWQSRESSSGKRMLVFYKSK